MDIIIHSLADVRMTAESPSANALDLLSGPMTLADRLALKSALTAFVQGLTNTVALVPDLQAALAARDARIAELEEQLAAALSAPAPGTVTKRQLKLWLLDHGQLAAVETMLQSIPDETERQRAWIEWTDASICERDHPLTLQMAGALHMDADAIDQAFAEAALL